MKEEEAVKALNVSLDKSPMVVFMCQALAKAGCQIDRNFFHIEKCEINVEGGFRPPDGVVLCSNHLETQEQINNVLTHELIHAYDHCRAANLNWSDCEHHACSEIRAANLSGDCAWKQEVFRGNVGISGQHQECVKRRATLSVNMNPNCAGNAREAVDKVYDVCFKDTAPFDRIP